MAKSRRVDVGSVQAHMETAASLMLTLQPKMRLWKRLLAACMPVAFLMLGLLFGRITGPISFANPAAKHRTSYVYVPSYGRATSTVTGALSRPGQTMYIQNKFESYHGNTESILGLSFQIHRIGYYEPTQGTLVFLPQPVPLDWCGNKEIPALATHSYFYSSFRSDRPFHKDATYESGFQIDRVGAYLLTCTWMAKYDVGYDGATSEPVLVIVEPRNSAGEFDITLVREAATRSFGSDAEWQEIQVMLGIEQPSQKRLQSDHLSEQPPKD